jgi:hypothetical protein
MQHAESCSWTDTVIIIEAALGVNCPTMRCRRRPEVRVWLLGYQLFPAVFLLKPQSAVTRGSRRGDVPQPRRLTPVANSKL